MDDIFYSCLRDLAVAKKGTDQALIARMQTEADVLREILSLGAEYLLLNRINESQQAEMMNNGT